MMQALTYEQAQTHEPKKLEYNKHYIVPLEERLEMVRVCIRMPITKTCKVLFIRVPCGITFKRFCLNLW